MNPSRLSALRAALWSLLWTVPSGGVEIRIDYTYDRHHFFADPRRRAALEAAADFYSDMLEDKLLGADPADFDRASWTLLVSDPSDPATTVSIDNPVVPEDVITVYVGAAELGQTLGRGGPAGWSASGFSDWFTRLRTRGNPGAGATPATDTAPLAGSISFDITTKFNFSLSEDLRGPDFITVALHELCHVLGIGTSDSWHSQVENLRFHGPASIRAFGTAPAIDKDGSHFAQGPAREPAFGAFGTRHGRLCAVLMVPSQLDDRGYLGPPTDLDLAALADIGWEVRPPLELTTLALGPTDTGFSWPSSSIFHYTLERSGCPTFSSPTAFPFAGDGRVQSWTDPTPPASGAFYRLRRDVVAPAVEPAAATRIRIEPDGPTTCEESPRMVGGCGTRCSGQSPATGG